MVSRPIRCRGPVMRALVISFAEGKRSHRPDFLGAAGHQFPRRMIRRGSGRFSESPKPRPIADR
jgi:hypothetical protein